MKTMIDPLEVSFPLWQVLEDESLLVHAAQSGDLDAFNAIVLKNQDVLYNAAYRILEQEDPASDALQEALISAFQYIHTFRGGSVKSWLVRIVINKCYDQLRHGQSLSTISLHETPDDDGENMNELWYTRLQQRPASVEEHVERLQLKEYIHECLNKLPRDFRTIVMLVDIDEMSYTEASAALGIPVGTVKSRLARARYDLRRILKARINL